MQASGPEQHGPVYGNDCHCIKVKLTSKIS